MKKILFFAFFVTLIDQVIKNVLVFNFDFGDEVVLIDNFFSITMLKNTGAAFSLFDSNTIFLILVSIFALNLIYFFLIRGKDLSNFEKIVLGVLIGGIMGNLIDRVIHGYVIDYLDFNLFGFNYPVFNFADISIVVSIVLIIIMVYKGENNGIQGK